MYGNAAVISYVRLTQQGGAAPVTASAEETRVWEKRDSKWVLVSGCGPGWMRAPSMMSIACLGVECLSPTRVHAGALPQKHQ